MMKEAKSAICVKYWIVWKPEGEKREERKVVRRGVRKAERKDERKAARKAERKVVRKAERREWI